MIPSTRVRLLAWSAVSLTLGASAANWPSWRGPDQNNISPEHRFPVEWSKDKNVKWRAPLPEPSNSSPIVWGDRVFVSQALRDGAERTLMCFDRKAGKLLWQKGVSYDEKDPRHETNPHCAATPVTDGQRVVVSFASAGIHCFDFEGKELWKTDLGPQKHEWGHGSSPVIHGDLVIVYHGPGKESALYGLDKRTGEKRWSTTLKETQAAQRYDGFAGKGDGQLGTWSTPLVLRAAGRDELVLPVVNKVRAFSPGSGRELWSCEGMNPLVYGSPTFGEGTLITFGGFFGSVVFIKPGGEGDVTGQRLFYDQRMKKHVIGSPVIKDGHIYLSVTEGFLQCYELATGRMVSDERLPTTRANSQTWGSPVLAGDKLYVMNQSGDTLVVRATPKFELLATNPLGETSNSTPALSDGEIFLRTHQALYCIRESSAAATP